MSDEDRPGRYPRGRTAVPRSPIQEDVTPPPADMTVLTQLGAVWESTRKMEKRMDLLFGSPDNEGIVQAMRKSIGLLEGRIVDIEGEVTNIHRERDVLLLRLANMEKLLEEQGKMLRALTENQQTERVESAVNKWATRLVLSGLALAGGAAFQFLMGKLG